MVWESWLICGFGLGILLGLAYQFTFNAVEVDKDGVKDLKL